MIPFAVRIIVIPAFALAAAAIAALVYFRPIEKSPAVATAPAPSSPVSPQSVPSAAPTINPRQSTAAVPQPPQAGPSTSAEPAPKLPEFDIVRVSPSGETVVAGRAPGAARVELLDQGKVIAGEKVDANGQFVLLPPPLRGGDHLLALRITPEGQIPVSSAQSVAVAVRPGMSPIVTLAEPGKPSVVLAAPAPTTPGLKPADSAAALPSGQVTIQTAEVEAGGRFFATGTAPPGSTVRLYLNGSHVADAATASDGKWSLTITKGLGGGKYALRADAVSGQGRVMSRAEVPFDAPVAVATAAPAPRSTPSAPDAAAPIASQSPRPATEPSALVTAARPAAPVSPGAIAHAPQTSAASQTRTDARVVAQPQTGTSIAGNDPTANPIVPEIATAKVTRGDSLWRISRLRFGKGMRYTVIYEANASQIRNPDLIYPGQVLVMPQN
jgi:nucleoid-associated protein YgaU